MTDRLHTTMTLHPGPWIMGGLVANDNEHRHDPSTIEVVTGLARCALIVDCPRCIKTSAQLLLARAADDPQRAEDGATEWWINEMTFNLTHHTLSGYRFGYYTDRKHNYVLGTTYMMEMDFEDGAEMLGQHNSERELYA
jgi:hypothetical protein